MIKLKSLFRRGPGPSGSKHSSSTNQQLKSASSASSSDNIDSIARPPKHYQESKDRSDQKYRGSRDKLGSRESLDVKDTTKQLFQPDNHQPRLQSMPLIQQHVGNNNMIDQRDVSNYSTVDPLADINFDGPKEVCDFIKLRT